MLDWNQLVEYTSQWLDAEPLLRVRAIAWRYVKAYVVLSSTCRTILELLLIFFVIRTWMQSRTRGASSGRNFVKLTEKEIDELVADWQPEPLVAADTEQPLTQPVIVGAPSLRTKVLMPMTSSSSASVDSTTSNTSGHLRTSGGSNASGSLSEKAVLNFASADFAGIAGNERIKEKAIECLRGYGVGSCGPSGFYGMFDVHLTLEKSLAEFLGVESAIIYAQGFSTTSSVIPAFAKRGDIIVADRGVNFAIQKGIQISRSTVYWYEHNDLDDLERVLRKVNADNKKQRKPLTRRFIVSEGLFELDGQVVDLPRLIELKLEFKYRLILDETWSFGVLGDAGRGVTELFDIPGTEVDIILGSMAVGLCSGGGFCAGSYDITHHQRINSPAYVYSASLPPLLAVSATEALHYLATPAPLPSTGVVSLPLAPLFENVQIIRTTLDKLSYIDIPSDPLSPMIHIIIRSTTSTSMLGGKPIEMSRFDQEKILQDVVDEGVANGVLMTRAQKVWSQETFQAKPSIRLCVSAALTKKEAEKAAAAIKTALIKVMSKKR